MVQTLDRQIAIYIPSTNGKRSINPARHVDRALALFARLFGGSTAYPARGAWLSESNELVTESISIVESFTTASTLAQYIDQVREYALELKHELNQESIAFKVNGKLELL